MKDNLILPKSATNPGVTFLATGNCHLYGDSRPEELDSFYSRITNYIKSLVEKRIPIHFIFHFTYFNTLAQRYLYDLLTIMDSQFIKGSIVWEYDTDDETIEDLGEQFKDMFPKLKIKLRSCEYRKKNYL
jgi:hypothetical protein